MVADAMNYLSHARNHLDDPYAMAGTSLPDWLRVLGRDYRIGPERLGSIDTTDAVTRSLVVGARRHFHDDAWFHKSPAFADVTGLIRDRIREVYPDPVGEERPRHIRASFFGHVAMELLLDGWLIERDPSIVDRYYTGLDALEDARVIEVAAALLGRAPGRLGELIAGFRKYPFLRTYVDDDEVRMRLSQVASRVRLPSLPEDFTAVVAWARGVVGENAERLLTEPEDGDSADSSPEA